MPKPAGLRTEVCWERGSVNNTAHTAQTKLMVKKVKKLSRSHWGPLKITWVFQVEGEGLRVVAGDVALGSLENPMMAKEF